MRAVIQRVSRADVEVSEKCIGKISQGLLVLLGIQEGDKEADLLMIVKKILSLRIFSDREGKMNLSVLDIQGDLLVISQFTLIADLKSGNRPSFFQAAKPDIAKSMFDHAVKEFRKSTLKVETGEFGANMKVCLVNDGPVTICLDSREWK